MKWPRNICSYITWIRSSRTSNGTVCLYSHIWFMYSHTQRWGDVLSDRVPYSFIVGRSSLVLVLFLSPASPLLSYILLSCLILYRLCPYTMSTGHRGSPYLTSAGGCPCGRMSPHGCPPTSKSVPLSCPVLSYAGL